MNTGSLKSLEGSTREERLANLGNLSRTSRSPFDGIQFTDEVNNHVHTRYSFSPYSPTQAAFMARMAGLRAVGSVDHDSIGAAEEVIEACKIAGIGSTVGFELRVDFSETPIGDRRLNNPDSIGIAYIVVHGVPRPRIAEVSSFLEPLQAARNERNSRQVDALNEILTGLSAPSISFDDVVASSMAHDGGSITERHILAAASAALIAWLGAGQALRRWVEEHVTGRLPDQLSLLLDDPANPHYVYDLLGVLKSSFTPQFFIQPSEAECIPVRTVVDFANSLDAIPAYAYLGDVGDSPTGDKKAQKFEDDFLDDLFEIVTGIGFRAVTYMPPRNTVEQLLRVQQLCTRHGLMEISGVDINSSRQSFRCPEILQPEFRHLIGSTWALIAHEKLTTIDPALSIFADQRTPLAERLARYARIGAAIDPAHPENAAEIARSR